MIDYEKKLQELRDKNRDVQVFYTPNYDNLSVEDKYYLELEVAKYKTWEEVKLYEKHGL